MSTSTSTSTDREVPAAPGGRARRTAQAVLAGVLVLGLGLGAHAVSGGQLPSGPLLIALAALTALAATLMAQARLPVWGVLLLLGVAQQLLHWILSGLGGAPSLSGPVDHHGEAAVPGGASGAAQGHSPEAMLMLHAHLGAALLIGWAVARWAKLTRWVARLREHPARTRERRPRHGTEAPPVPRALAGRRYRP